MCSRQADILFERSVIGGPHVQGSCGHNRLPGAQSASSPCLLRDRRPEYGEFKGKHRRTGVVNCCWPSDLVQVAKPQGMIWYESTSAASCQGLSGTPPHGQRWPRPSWFLVYG